MTLGGHKDIKLYINRMPKSKTYRRRHLSKRKTSRRHSRRHTRKRSGGGCEDLRAEFERIKTSVERMRTSTYENKHSKVRSLHNEAERAMNALKTRAQKGSCQSLINEIDTYENTVLKNKTTKLFKNE